MLQFILHSDLTEEIIDQIIRIKMTAWPYTYDEHKRWLEANITTNDLHVLMSDGENMVGYLNLIKISFRINENPFFGYGIGNVCAWPRGIGYGKKLMEEVNDFLLSTDQQGVLLCKKTLIQFYSNLGWKLIDRNNVHASYTIEEINTMIFNYRLTTINTFHYAGKSF